MKTPLGFACATLILLASSGVSSAATRATATLDRYVDLPLEMSSPVEPPLSRTFRIESGDSRERVLTACGRPDRVINRNLWLYATGRSSAPAARAHGCDTLLVAFANDRVSALKLVNRAVLDAALAKRPRPAAVAATP